MPARLLLSACLVPQIKPEAGRVPQDTATALETEILNSKLSEHMCEAGSSSGLQCLPRVVEKASFEVAHLDHLDEQILERTELITVLIGHRTLQTP